MEFLLEQQDVVSIGVSVLCGSMIGFEREYNNKSAGFRTIILICLGSTIFTIVSSHGQGSDDRIAANIITGIGFIGAGVIFKDGLNVMGLTTAAVIWTAAGIGMAAGIGYHWLAFCLTVCTIIILSLFGKVDLLLGRLHHTKTVNITFKDTELHNVLHFEKELRNRNMKYRRTMLNKRVGQLSAIFKITATAKQFALLAEELIKTDAVAEFH